MIIAGTFLFANDVEAKFLPRFAGQRIVSSGLVVYPKLRPDRLALIFTLSNLQKMSVIP